MGVNLSIKNVPEGEVDRLRARAKRNHRSLQGELRAIIQEAVGLPQKAITVEELIDMGRKSGLRTPSESVRMVREDRDR